MRDVKGRLSGSYWYLYLIQKHDILSIRNLSAPWVIYVIMYKIYESILHIIALIGYFVSNSGAQKLPEISQKRHTFLVYLLIHQYMVHSFAIIELKY